MSGIEKIKELEVQKALEERLKKYNRAADAIPQDFDSTLRRKLLAASNTAQDKKFSIFDMIIKPYFYMPATVAVALFFTIMYVTGGREIQKQDNNFEEPVLLSSAEVESGKPVTIEIEYEAARDINSVEVAIVIDEGISFYSKNSDISSKKTLTWKGSLAKGKNLIPFVVAVQKNGAWDINTKADFEGYSHLHKVRLTADEKKIVVAYYRLSSVKLNDAL